MRSTLKLALQVIETSRRYKLRENVKYRAPAAHVGRTMREMHEDRRRLINLQAPYLAWFSMRLEADDAVTATQCDGDPDARRHRDLGQVGRAIGDIE